MTTAPRSARAPRAKHESVATRRVMLRRRGKPTRDTRELRELAQHLRQIDLSFETGHQNALNLMGKRIRDRRLELLLTQTQVAAAVGMGGQSYGQIERGTNGVRFGHLLRIAHALNTTISKMLEGVTL